MLFLFPQNKKKKKKLFQHNAQGSSNAGNLLLEIPSIVELCMISSHEQIETWAGRCKVGINPNFESKQNPEQSRQITLPNGENSFLHGQPIITYIQVLQLASNTKFWIKTLPRTVTADYASKWRKFILPWPVNNHLHSGNSACFMNLLPTWRRKDFKSTFTHGEFT